MLVIMRSEKAKEAEKEQESKKCKVAPIVSFSHCILLWSERGRANRIKNPCKSLAWGVIVWRYAGDEPVVVFAHATIIHPKPKEESMLIIAIDLGKFNSVACIYNTQTDSLGTTTKLN